MKCIAVAGNPNAGKTTVFNALAGTRQKVANYPGVTVEQKEATLRLRNGESVILVDLPGCYSLTARSPEEQIAHDVLFGRISKREKPSLVLCVVDASNLERNLYLVTQLIDQNIPLIVILNMIDIAAEKGYQVDPTCLETVLGCPVIPTIARKGEGMDQVLDKINFLLAEPYTNGNHRAPFINSLPPILEEPVRYLSDRFTERGLIPSGKESRPEALWALLANLDGDEAVRLPPLELELTRKTLNEHHLTTTVLRKQESEARYAYISELLKDAQFHHTEHLHTLTEKLDGVFLHLVFGPIIFAGVFALVFQAIFSWSGPAMEVIDSLFGWLAGIIETSLPDSLFRGLLVEGILAGVGNTVIFLPQILILFLFLGILEDTGYLARAAFIMDRLMSAVGLDGKAFVPLLSSFACAVPGIMTTRTIPNRKDRLVTILVAPLMSCSARLPVYTLVIGTVFVADQKIFGFFNVGGVVLLFLYFLGVVMAIVVAAIFKKTLLKSPKPILLLELPTYKQPSLKTLLLLLWDRSLQFLTRAGTVILAVTILLWGFLSFPRDNQLMEQFVVERSRIESNTDLPTAAKTEALRELNARERESILENSLGGRFGRLIEPLIHPLGFDWKIGIGLISSFAAREVFVSTMGVIYGIGGDESGENSSLRQALRAEKREGSDLPLYTPLVGLSLLVFYVFACQCMSTLAVVKRETHSWAWPTFMFVYMSLLAWGMSFLVFQTGRLLGYS